MYPPVLPKRVGGRIRNRGQIRGSQHRGLRWLPFSSGMVFFLCFPETPPEKVRAKKGLKAAQQGLLLAKADNPNQFAVGLKDACCEDPGCCILGTCCIPATAFWARDAVLAQYANGIEDFRCCQGYIPSCCCCPRIETLCQGSYLGLCCEACWCGTISLSIARIHMMDAKSLRPDPCDWQIIHLANCLQLASLIFDIVELFSSGAREASCILDLVADCFTWSVAGCMVAQIHTEIQRDLRAANLEGQGQPNAILVTSEAPANTVMVRSSNSWQTVPANTVLASPIAAPVVTPVVPTASAVVPAAQPVATPAGLPMNTAVATPVATPEAVPMGTPANPRDALLSALTTREAELAVAKRYKEAGAVQTKATRFRELHLKLVAKREEEESAAASKQYAAARGLQTEGDELEKDLAEMETELLAEFGV